MKVNKWTIGLAAVGLVSLPAVTQAEEKMSSVQTQLAGTTISGYVDTAATWNFGTGNQNLPAYAYNNQGKADGFSLNAVRLTIEKPLDEAQWAAGYKVDMMMGANAQSFGSPSFTGTANAASDFAIRQAYVNLRAPVGTGLDFKVGVFDNVLGYETHDAGNNPNYTRSYGYTIEPVSHTGVLASYRFCEEFRASAGIANTYGPQINQRDWVVAPTKAESYKTYMFTMALTAPKDWGWLAGSELYGGVDNGFNSFAGGIDQTSWYAGLAMATPVKDLRVGLAYDYVGFSKQALMPNNTAWADAASAYVSYKLSEKLSIHARAEYFWQDDDLVGVTGIPSKVFATTATLQYDLWKNVLSRLEFRWDHAADGTYAYGANETVVGKTGPGTRRNAYMLAANIIYNF